MKLTTQDIQNIISLINVAKKNGSEELTVANLTIKLQKLAEEKPLKETPTQSQKVDPTPPKEPSKESKSK